MRYKPLTLVNEQYKMNAYQNQQTPLNLDLNEGYLNLQQLVSSPSSSDSTSTIRSPGTPSYSTPFFQELQKLRGILTHSPKSPNSEDTNFGTILDLRKSRAGYSSSESQRSSSPSPIQTYTGNL